MFGAGRCGFYFHHMGTTRMADDATEGVVDANCRVHGVENLFVAGSSVFPTGATAAPTLTIVALAIRLADHIRHDGSLFADRSGIRAARANRQGVHLPQASAQVAAESSDQRSSSSGRHRPVDA